MVRKAKSGGVTSEVRILLGAAIAPMSLSQMAAALEFRFELSELSATLTKMKQRNEVQREVVLKEGGCGRRSVSVWSQAKAKDISITPNNDTN